MSRPITISGTGCCLVDQIYPDINFSSPLMEKYMSRNKGDGGLHPGRLVFSEHFGAYANTSLGDAIEEIIHDRTEPAYNVGGPSIVALIHTAQLLQGKDYKVQFYGVRGDDTAGEYLRSMLGKTPVALNHFAITKGSTPSTVVLSDPSFHGGDGERIFINDIGAAWNFGPEDLPESFFESNITVFGGTALVPGLHKGLTQLLKKSRKKGAITVVNTVYDFHNELENPGKRWPLGDSEESYQYIDLLIMDREEAEHLSGKEDLSEAGLFFMERGVSSYIITNGTDDTTCNTNGEFFFQSRQMKYPVSASLVKALSRHEDGDTTGSGDNFVGGVLASMAWQLSEGKKKLDLEAAISWGTVSGGYGCFTVGGCILEKNPGEKLKGIQPYYEQYRKQIQFVGKIVIFGAGKIGRSFIGQLFGLAGYGLVFVDMDADLVNELNQRGSYPVIIKGPQNEEKITINKVSAIHALDQKAVVDAICKADIMAVSVGKSALAKVAEVVSLGLQERERRSPGKIMDIILAENMRSADNYFRKNLGDNAVGLVETSIGKMVPIMTSEDLEEDALQVFAEPYNTLILDKKGFKAEIPPIKEFALKENMKAWVDRKAFIHNLGHATAAYAGYVDNPNAVYLYEALANKKVLDFTRLVMEESARILLIAYPDEFTQEGLSQHIEDLLQRFQNKKLGDTIYRVGCDLHRKLGKNDRFMGIIQMAKELGLAHDLILEAMSKGFHFKGKDEFGRMLPEDEKFHRSWARNPDEVLKDVCGFQNKEEIQKIRQMISNIFTPPISG